jgi:hypothetical protein
VACVWFAALDGTLTGVEGELFDMMATEKEDDGFFPCVRAP